MQANEPTITDVLRKVNENLGEMEKSIQRDIKASMGDILEAVNSGFTQMESRFQGFKGDLSRMEARYYDLKGDLTREIWVVKDEVREMKVQSRRIETKIDDLTNSVDGLVANQLKLETELAAHHSVHQRFDDRITKIENRPSAAAS